MSTHIIISQTIFSQNGVADSHINRSSVRKNLSDYNWTRTHNYLAHKQTLNHLAKLAEF